MLCIYLFICQAMCAKNDTIACVGFRVRVLSARSSGSLADLLEVFPPQVAELALRLLRGRGCR